MKLIEKCPKFYTCDECDKDIAGKSAILLGEESDHFKEDARQTLICFDCVKKSFSLFNKKSSIKEIQTSFKEWKEKSQNCIRKDNVICNGEDGKKRFCDIAICTGIE